MRRPLIAALLVVVLLLLFAWASLLFAESQKQEPQVKWRTHYSTTEKTVPGPERTVEKTIPGPERTVERTVPCKLPDSGGGD